MREASFEILDSWTSRKTGRPLRLGVLQVLQSSVDREMSTKSSCVTPRKVRGTDQGAGPNASTRVWDIGDYVIVWIGDRICNRARHAGQGVFLD